MIVTTSPGPGSVHGVKYVMVGEQFPGFAFAKSVGLLAVSLALVTWIVPLASPATVAQISFPDTTLNSDTGVPPMSTLVTIGFLKFVPLITTKHPVGPLVGENDEMVGGTANAGVSRAIRTEAAATPTPTKRRTGWRFARVMASSSRSASQIELRARQSAHSIASHLLGTPGRGGVHMWPGSPEPHPPSPASRALGAPGHSPSNNRTASTSQGYPRPRDGSRRRSW